jgi:hypothetical protein
MDSFKEVYYRERIQKYMFDHAQHKPLFAPQRPVFMCSASLPRGGKNDRGNYVSEFTQVSQRAANNSLP